jgi:hypothetical protein
MHIIHEGFETFRKGTFGNAGANLFVDAKGVIRRIADQDLDGNGCYDIIMPNSHGYIERGPTTIFSKKDGHYEGRDLPHDSCWTAIVADVDNDGYEDLIIANGENGVSSILTSYVYYGGPDGLNLVRKLLQQTEGKLSSGASIFLEIGSEQAEVLKNESANYPWLEFAGIHKDYCGNIRFVSYKSK